MSRSLILFNELPKSDEASGAVGGEIAFFPPASDGIEQLADARSRRDAEPDHVIPAEREGRDVPGLGKFDQLAQAGRFELAIGGEEQR